MSKVLFKKIVAGICVFSFIIGSIYLGVHYAKNGVARTIAEAKEAVGFTPQPFYENKVIVLMYHHIDPVQKSKYTITPELFHEQLTKLKEEQFNVISMEQFLAFHKNKAPVPPNAVLITFDDGYESFYQYAYPELKQWGYPATSFIIVGATDKPYLSSIPHLTWDEIREMQANQITFYSHTYNQHDYQRLNAKGIKKPALTTPSFIEEEDRMETAAEYEQRVRNDLTLAKTRLEQELGTKVPQNLLCFPYGAYNDTVLSIAKSIGIDTFFLVQPGISSPEDPVIYRVDGGSPKMVPDELIRTIEQHVDPANNGISFDPPPIGVKVNGKMVQPTTAPYSKEGKLYVPFRVVLEALGADVEWDQQTKTLTAKRGENKVVLTVGSLQAQVNGEDVTMDSPAENEEAAVMVPVRFVGEALGAQVNWDEEQNLVSIIAK